MILWADVWNSFGRKDSLSFHRDKWNRLVKVWCSLSLSWQLSPSHSYRIFLLNKSWLVWSAENDFQLGGFQDGCAIFQTFLTSAGALLCQEVPPPVSEALPSEHWCPISPLNTINFILSLLCNIQVLKKTKLKQNMKYYWIALFT